MKYTDWRPILTDATFRNPDTGETEYSWRWIQYNDDEIAIDLANILAEGETASDLDLHLWRLAATDEAVDPVAADDKLQGDPVLEGSVVKQRISGLEPFRVYRLFVGVGPAGNHRNITAVIEVVG